MTWDLLRGRKFQSKIFGLSLEIFGYFGLNLGLFSDSSG